MCTATGGSSVDPYTAVTVDCGTFPAVLTEQPSRRQQLPRLIRRSSTSGSPGLRLASTSAMQLALLQSEPLLEMCAACCLGLLHAYRSRVCATVHKNSAFLGNVP